MLQRSLDMNDNQRFILSEMTTDWMSKKDRMGALCGRPLIGCSRQQTIGPAVLSADVSK